MGDIEWLLNYKDPINVVCCIGNSESRSKIIKKLQGKANFVFPNIVADNVKYSKNVTFGKGNIICASNILTVNVEIKDFVIINLDCTVGHDAIIEDFVTIYPGVHVSGNVQISNHTEIGTGSCLIQNVKIGANVIVGAGSVVIKDLPKNCTAVGVPAKVIKTY